MGLEEHNSGEFTLYIQTPGMRFTGIHAGAYPDPPPSTFPIVDWIDDTVRFPEFTVTMAASPLGPPRTIPSEVPATLPAPAAYVEIPVNFVDLPDRVVYVSVACRLSVSGPAGLVDFDAAGPWSEENEAGWAETFTLIPVSRSLHRTLRVPIYLRPFMTRDDVRGVSCDTMFRAERTGGGVDQILASPATDPASSGFLSWLRPMASSPRVLSLKAEIRRR